MDDFEILQVHQEELCTHISSAVELASALHSDFILERDTLACFLDFWELQLIKLRPWKIAYPRLVADHKNFLPNPHQRMRTQDQM
jgi:hypothetical protein